MALFHKLRNVYSQTINLCCLMYFLMGMQTNQNVFFFLLAVKRPSIPTNFHSTTAASTYIILTWSQPIGEVVDSYNISYSGHPVRAPPMDVFNGSMSVNGFLRCFNLTGAVHESMYNISIMATNMAGSSAPAKVVVYTPIGSCGLQLCVM